MEVHGGATCSPWKGPHAGAGGFLKEAVTLWRARAGADFCQDLRTRGERTPGQSRFAGRACDPVGDPRWSSLFLKDCTLREGLMLGQFVKSCSLWEGLSCWRSLWRTVSCERDLMLEQGQRVRSPIPEEEGGTETTCDELTPTPIPRPSAPLGGEEGEKGE